MEEADIRAALDAMLADPALVTNSVYRADSVVWEDNRMPFADAHIAYLRAHSNVDPRHYLANLRLRIKRNPRISP